ncbi:YfiT family bacillithiol transferase [Bacillus sp. SCS-151]|uniref:YfiT family bacillithiol transferase n=1 Tax=Nanhaiella sioensis TaxID=3115293 RepID=UPI0039788EF0
MEDLRYPIGKPKLDDNLAKEQLDLWINQIEKTPLRLQQTVKGLSEAQLNTAYRPEGWTVRQVVHHVADAHINGFIRFKWTLTENEPHIKAYDQQGFAQLHDSSSAPIDLSLDLLTALHKKWVVLLRSLQPSDLEKQFIHPDSGVVKLKTAIGIYAWHGRHHIAHITSLIDRRGWKNNEKVIDRG